MSFVAAGNYVSSPKGCLNSEWDGRGVFYNGHASGKSQPNQGPICSSNIFIKIKHVCFILLSLFFLQRDIL